MDPQFANAAGHPTHTAHATHPTHTAHAAHAAHAAHSAHAGGPSGTGTGTTTSPAPLSAPRKLSGRRRRETVAVLLFSGAPIFESSIPLSVFGVDRQDAGVPRYRLLVCAGEDGPLATTGGLTLTAPHGLEALGRAGTIVVPAWRSISQPPPAEAIAALRKAHHEGARIIGLCTGAFVLAAAGLLDGRPATTHWMYAPTLAKRYPRVHVDPRELFVDDGDVLTSAGTAAGIDLCLHVVRTDHGAEAANALARRLVVPNRRSGGGQAQYIDQSLPEEIGNDPLAEVVTWALENLNQQFDVEVLAARAYMSRRTFDRRFRTLTGSAPLQWLITQRVLQAQRLLETSELSVDDVARRCGFRSPVALRGHFRRQLGVSPAAYRTAYRARRPAPVATVPPQAQPADRQPIAPSGLSGHPGQGAHGAHPGHNGSAVHPNQASHPGAAAAGSAHPQSYAPATAGYGAPHDGRHSGSNAGSHSAAPTSAHPGQPSGARQRPRPLVPSQAGPNHAHPGLTPGGRLADRPNGRPATSANTPATSATSRGGSRDSARDSARGGRDTLDDRTVEHAVADEHGQDEPSARGQAQGAHPESGTAGAPETAGTAGPAAARGGQTQRTREGRALTVSRDRAVG